MSEQDSRDFNVPIDELNIQILDAMASFDDQSRVLHGLVEAVIEDAPDVDVYAPQLGEASTELVMQFKNMAEAAYNTDPIEARDLMVKFWLNDDNQRAEKINDFAETDLLKQMEESYISSLFDGLEDVSDDEDAFMAGLVNLYTKVLGNDMSVICNFVQEKHEKNELDRLIIIDPEVVKDKIKKAALFAAGLSLGSVLAASVLKLKHK